jgi:predicted ATPase/class 3 adenylate cyclase
MAELPAGTVTFLFTDIEGSTRLWEEHPDAMRAALLQHDDLLRACIESHGGRVFKTMGDAFCAVFANPRGAIETVLAAQQWLPALALQTSDGARPLKVRMALHTGVAEERDGDYFGQPLNRVARLLAAGYGGQVLLSLATAELIRDSLPSGASLGDLGQHRLKDLGRPETVFQLGHPDLPADFPPLRSLDNPELKHNLPQQVTSFIGREKELAEVKALLRGELVSWRVGDGGAAPPTHQLTNPPCRLLTLTGSGGCGKTRLALQAAADRVEEYPDGVWLVELAALTDPALVPQTAAEVLGLSDEPGKSLIQTLTDHLKSKRLLLLLDNCEHLLEACAWLADALLRQCPRVLILATSREGLGIAGETTYRVPSLTSPDPRRPQTPASLSQYDSVQLFIERAGQAAPGFQVTNRNAPALASVCFRLDGIPLAIELAAARVRSLTVEDINARLDQRFRLLTGGSRTALPRQQTLRSLIDWSYDLLNDSEKALLCRSSVFAGGWTLDAAEAVCADEWENGGMGEWASRPGAPIRPLSHSPIHSAEIVDLLTSLADKSLVVAETAGATVRYQLLETVRQYALDRLAESGEAEIWTDRHLAHFLGLVEEAQQLFFGPEGQTWLDRIEAEHDNLRAAWARSTEGAGELERAFQLCAAMYEFWIARGRNEEGRLWCAAALERRKDEPKSAAYARTVHCSARLARNQGDYASAWRLVEESLSIQRELNDWQGAAFSLNTLGLVAKEQGDYESARAFHEESLSIRRRHGDRMGVSQALNNLGVLASEQGDYDSARSLLEESLSIRREIGWRRGYALVLNSLAEVTFEQGDFALARSLAEESLLIRRELADDSGIAEALWILGCVAHEHGDLIAARSLHQESLSIRRDLRLRPDIATSLESFADLAMAGSEIFVAARLWGAAEALREEIGRRLPLGAMTRHNTRVAAARADAWKATGDEAAFAAAWAEGRAMTMEPAIGLALEMADAGPPVPPSGTVEAINPTPDITS